MTYSDSSKNVMKNEANQEVEKYESEVIAIDSTAPVLGFEFEQTTQKTIFTVTEHNFRSEDIVVTGTIEDISGNPSTFTVEALTAMLQAATWTQDEADADTYICEIDAYIDGNYDLTINYEDVIGNVANTCEPDVFMIDHTKPYDVAIAYSKSIVDTVLETVTLGFYNPNVTVTFTAYDQASGVGTFTWSYVQQEGTSTSKNRPTDDEETIALQKVQAIQDTANKSKYTAEITLTATEAEQLRGCIAVVATDKYNNASDKVTDEGYVLVVDTISPTMTVEYSKESKKDGTKSYYKEPKVTFTVNEANFFEEDVKVTVTKDGGTPYAVTPKWTNKNADVHIGTYTISKDGEYVINVEYTDRSTNAMESYTSHTLVVDATAPVVSVEYTNADAVNVLTDNDGNERKYFADKQTAVVTVKEQHFSADNVVFTIEAKDVAGQGLDADSLYSKSKWSTDKTGKIHTITITYPGDANYSFDIECSDLAGNQAKDYETNYFTVDSTAPTNLSISYSTSILDIILDAISFGFYNAKATVTIVAEDATSGVHSFLYSYVNAAGVSSVNAEQINQTISASEITYSNGGATATATFDIPRDALNNSNQFNGTVNFKAVDRAGRESSYDDNKRIVVDSIAPTAQVSYNEPVNVEGDISYYDGNINGTVTINEANFHAQDVVVMVSKNGAAPTAISPSWSNNSVDVHTGSFTLSEDGDYIITISYVDKASNEMMAYTSNQLTIDTDITPPTIKINGISENGKAYPDKVVPEVSFEDKNFRDYEILLTRTSYGSKDVDVTDKFIRDYITVNANGGAGVFDTFEKVQENDGIYTLTVSVTDKAGHREESTVKFTVNRFGSVYEYSDYLISLIENGGAYKKEIAEDLIITEYNADRLVGGSLNIEITRDGKPLDEVKYEVTPNITDQVVIGDSGWFQYKYSISKDNFVADGVYKISVSSEDATGNTPENSNYDNKNILFRVDNTVPEITSIVGLEESIINAQEVEVKYTVFDAIGLKSIGIYVNGILVEEITDFSADMNNYSGSFILGENASAQTVRVVVEDLAENVTDTASEEFSSAYVFNKSVTVSTNFLVRWYANEPLFWGSIGGVAVIAAGFGMFVVAKRKKKQSEAN